MPRDTSSADETEQTSTGPSTGTGGETLAALLFGGVLGVGLTGTASADPQGQVGTNSDPASAVYADELNGGVTGDQSVTSLTGTDLSIDGSDALSASATLPDVDDGTTSVSGTSGVTFGSKFVVTDLGGGSARVDLDVATDYREAAKLTADDGDADDIFGESVALSGDGTTALMGATGDELSDGDGDREGSAYIFENTGGWRQMTKLSNSGGDDFDFFGESVALDADGTTALVGAKEDAGGGSVYVYEYADSGGWSQVTNLTADGGDSSDSFGDSVALSADGTTALVGAYFDDNDNGTEAGSAYVFDGSDGWSGVTTETTKLTASDGDAGDEFGWSVALSADGTTALVGATQHDEQDADATGSAYLFKRSGGWSGVTTETTKLYASDGDRAGLFGWSVALSEAGTTALVGAGRNDRPDGSLTGAAYLFDGSGGWSGVSTETTKLYASDGDDEDRLGYSVALGAEGTTALVGAYTDGDPNGSDAGSVYGFDGSGGWAGVSTETTKLTAADGDGDDYFGASVALGSDGATALVGARQDDTADGDFAGSAYLYYETV